MPDAQIDMPRPPGPPLRGPGPFRARRAAGGRGLPGVWASVPREAVSAGGADGKPVARTHGGRPRGADIPHPACDPQGIAAAPAAGGQTEPPASRIARGRASGARSPRDDRFRLLRRGHRRGARQTEGQAWASPACDPAPPTEAARGQLTGGAPAAPGSGGRTAAARDRTRQRCRSALNAARLGSPGPGGRSAAGHPPPGAARDHQDPAPPARSHWCRPACPG